MGQELETVRLCPLEGIHYFIILQSQKKNGKLSDYAYEMSTYMSLVTISFFLYDN